VKDKKKHKNMEFTEKSLLLVESLCL